MADIDKVRALFVCLEKIQTADGYRIKFSAVYGDGEEAKKFFKQTPSGALEMGTVNDAAAAMFVPGRRYYLDLTPAPAE